MIALISTVVFCSRSTLFCPIQCCIFENYYIIDGVSVGVSLESATDAEIEELDRLLSQLANLKVAEQVVEPEASKDYTQVGVAKEDVKWGSSVAGVGNNQ